MRRAERHDEGWMGGDNHAPHRLYAAYSSLRNVRSVESVSSRFMVPCDGSHTPCKNLIQSTSHCSGSRRHSNAEQRLRVPGKGGSWQIKYGGLGELVGGLILLAESTTFQID